MTIKISRAYQNAEIGKYPASREAMLKHLPDELIKTLTSRELAMVLDALWSCAEAAKVIAEQEIVAEGAVWDAKTQRLIELQN